MAALVLGDRPAHRLRKLLAGQPVGLGREAGQRPGNRPRRPGRQVDRPADAQQHDRGQPGQSQIGPVQQHLGAGPQTRPDVPGQLRHVVQDRGQRRPPGLRVGLQRLPVAGAERELLEVGCLRCRTGAEQVVLGRDRGRGGVLLELLERDVAVRTQLHELQELALPEPAGREHPVQERALPGGDLLRRVQHGQRLGAEPHLRVGGVVEREVDLAELLDHLGVAVEHLGPVGVTAVGVGADRRQRAHLVERLGDLVLQLAVAGGQGLHRLLFPVGALPGRGHLGAERLVAGEQAGGHPALGLHLPDQGLHRQVQRDRAIGTRREPVVGELLDHHDREQQQHRGDGKRENPDDAAPNRAPTLAHRTPSVPTRVPPRRRHRIDGRQHEGQRPERATPAAGAARARRTCFSPGRTAYYERVAAPVRRTTRNRYSLRSSGSGPVRSRTGGGPCTGA